MVGYVGYVYEGSSEKRVWGWWCFFLGQEGDF